MAAKRENRIQDINEEVISKHNYLVDDLSVQIVEDDFQSLKDLFKDCPRAPKDLINITTVQELFVKLKKNENISIGHYEYFTERLEEVDKSLASYVRREEQDIRDILNAGRSPTKRLRTEQECIKPANSAVVRFNLPIVKSESKCCIAIGNTGIIRCQILGEVGRVLWKKRKDADEHFNDIAIDNNKYIGGSVASPSLVIEPVSEEDAGKYICQAENSAGVAQSAEIEVTVTKDNVSVMPATYNHLMEVVQSTQTTNLHLTLIENVNNSIVGNNGLVVNQVGANESDNTGLLDILAEKSSDAQDVVKRFVEAFGEMSDFRICCQPDIREIRVHCTIMNGEPNSTLRDTLQKQIATALNAEERIVNIELIKHCIISFDITGARFPWEMSALTLAERFRSGVEDGSISLADESGHALSICKDSTRIELKDTSDNTDKPVPGVPLVSIGQSGYMVTAGEISVLKCTALSSVPVTSVRWFRINKEDRTTTAIEIDNNKYFGGSTESPSLVINDTIHEDEGLYLCRAENTNGVGESPPVVQGIFENTRILQKLAETLGKSGSSSYVRQSETPLPEIEEMDDEQYWKIDSIHSQASDIKKLNQPSSAIKMDETEGVISVNDKGNPVKAAEIGGHTTLVKLLRDEMADKNEDKPIQTTLPIKQDETQTSAHSQSAVSVQFDINTDIESVVEIVKKGDIEQFELLTKRLKTLDTEGIPVVSILHVVALYGSPEMIECIAKRQDIKWDVEYNVREYLFGIDVPQLREGTFTALYIATVLDRTKIVLSLIKYSCEENIDFCFPTLHKNKEMEEIFMLDQAEKLKLKHSDLKPTVIPGHRLEKDGSRTPVYIVYSVHVNHISSYKLRSIGVVIIRNPYAYNKEWKDVSNNAKTVSFEDRVRAKKILSRYQQSLLTKHSNLNIINVTSVRFQNNGVNIVEKPCIAFYCSTKGVVPLGEPEFPKRLDTGDGEYMEVDVHEGHFILDVYNSLPSSHFHPDLKMGCNIGRSTNEYDASGNLLRFIGGTLGPFVKFNNKIGFITCAHVLFDIPNQDRFRYQCNGTNLVEVVQPSRDSSVFGGAPCGNVDVAIFDPTLDPSVDVAVVELTDQSRVPAKGRFANENHSSYLDAGFAELPEYNSGLKQEDLKEFATNHIVYKFGSASDVTKGTLDVSGISVRTLTTALGLPRSGRDVIMKNQYKVTGCSPTWTFFTNGDSGSGVFMKKSGTGELVVVGMGIGDAYLSTSPVPVGVVTPIGSILNALGQQFSLASFP